MIKHIITDEAILIPTSKGVIQYQKDDDLYNDILTLVMKEDSTLEDIKKLNSSCNYEDDDIVFIQEKNTDSVEVIFNGRYHFLNHTFVSRLIQMLKLNDGFQMKHAANFIKRLLKNNFNLTNTLEKLLEIGFLYTPSGQIISVKNFENEGKGVFAKKRSFAEKDMIKKTFILINPEDIDAHFNFDQYIVLANVMGPEIFGEKYQTFLNGSCIGDADELFNIFNVFEKCKNNYLLKDIEDFTSFNKEIEEKLGVEINMKNRKSSEVVLSISRLMKFKKIVNNILFD